jgi:FkbM family methyltransferase
MKLNFPLGDTHFKKSDWDDYQLLQYRQAVAMCKARKKLAIDCGAHAGIMTRRMSKDFKRVLSFEPVHWALLGANTADLKNVTIVPHAVSNGTGSSKISTNIENSGDNRVTESGDREIQTVRLDDYDTDEVGLIKLDIQGHEYAALLGARQTILHDHPTILIEMERWDENAPKIEALLADWDYQLIQRRNADRIYVWQGW